MSASVQPAIAYIETTFSGRVYDTKHYAGEAWGYLRSKPFSVTMRCTGFGVNPDGYIATAGHCAEFSDDIRAMLIAQAAKYDWSTNDWANETLSDVLAYGLDHYRIDGERTGHPDLEIETVFGISLSGEHTGEWHAAQVVNRSGFSKLDVALLKIEAEDVPSLLLAREAEIGVGTDVVSVGFAAITDLVTDATLDPSFMPGTVSAERTMQNGLLQVYEVSADVSGGMSGGPAVDAGGRVVGLNSFGIRGASNPNYIRPAAVIQQMLDKAGVANEQGQVDQLYLAGLQAYFAGDKATALAYFDKVLDLAPSHQLAQEFRSSAVRLPDPPAPSGLGRPVLLAGITLLTLLGTGTVVLVIRRRRTDEATATTVPPIPIVLASHPVDATDAGDRPDEVVATVIGTNGTRHCTRCGARQTPDARFCAACGAEVARPTTV